MSDFKPGLKIYLGIIIATVIFTLFAVFGSHLKVTSADPCEGYTVLKDMVPSVLTGREYPCGVAESYIISPGMPEDHNEVLMFYTKHSNVAVYADGECIYEIKTDPRGLWELSPGHVWNKIPLLNYEGAKLEIVIIPVYKQVIGRSVTFYLGNGDDIRSAANKQSWASTFIAQIVIITGLFFILFVPMFRGQSRKGKDLLLLGLFSVEMGLWGVMEQDSFLLMDIDPVAATTTIFLLLMIMPSSLLWYFRETLSHPDHPLWNVTVGFNIVAMLLVLLGEITTLAHVRQTIILTHLQMVVTIACLTYMFVLENRERKNDRFMRRMFFGVGMSFAGALIDVALYYINEDIPRFAMILGFLFFIYFMGTNMLIEARNLVDAGSKAVSYEKIAFHDQLTGAMNRAAFSYDTGAPEFKKEGCIVVMFDLNNLKAVNDNLGHDKGDIYIKESARILQECFGPMGSVYRMGGDEFCSLIHDKPLEAVRGAVKKMREACDKWNASSKDIVMQIACGYQLYDFRMDYDIADTGRRADKLMYHNKLELKQMLKTAHSDVADTETKETPSAAESVSEETISPTI